MQALTREKLLAELSKVHEIVNHYQSGSRQFADLTLKWLQEVEQCLQQLRNPAAAAVTAAKARLLAVSDGHREPSLAASSSSSRKAGNATAALVLNHMVELLQGIIADIDAKLDSHREKIAQLLALASSKNPIPLPQNETRRTWLQQVWKSLGSYQETLSMYLYLQASLSASDRRYILEEMLDRLFAE
ncbi:MAG: hypothetical protein ACOC0S_06995 [Desulfohalobiaceae bacterium]